MQSTPSKSQFWTLMLVVFIDLLGFGIIIPILPYYAKEFGASATELGWLMASYSLMQFFFSPVWGSLSDRYGRRPILCMSILGTALSLTFLGLATSLPMLFAGRIFAGIFGANISTAYAYMTDITTEENRAKGMGMIGAAFGLGFIFGPAIGGLLSSHGFAAPLFFGAGLAVINFLFALKKLKEPELTAEQRSAHRSKRFSLDTWRQALADRRSRFAIASFLFVTIAVTQMEVSFALFLAHHYSLDAKSAGILLALVGLVMASVQGGAIHKLVKKWGQPRLILFGQLIAAASLILFGSVPEFSLLVIALIGLAIGNGVLQPTLSSLASLGAPPEHRGAVMGVFQSAGSIARVVGPPTAGILYDRINPSAPFYSGSVVLILLALVSLFRLKRASPQGTAPQT